MRFVPIFGVGAVALGVLGIGIGIGVGCGSFSGDGGGANVSEAGTSEAGPGATDSSTAPETGTADAAPNPGVFCSGTFCDPRSQVCCKAPSVGGPACIPKEAAGDCPSVTLGCDDGADCAFISGGVCCARLASDDVTPAKTTCFTLAQCKTTSFWGVFCDPDALNACPGNVACTVPDGGAYGLCAGLIYH